MTYKLILVIVRLAIVCFIGVTGEATIEDVRLVGGNNNYINIRSDIAYILRCSYTTPFDDPVKMVRWYKDQKLMYRWHEGETVASAFRDLIGKVWTSTKEQLQNLHFNKRITLNLSGNYTCKVESRKGTAESKPFPLVVLDIPSDEYLSNVSLMSGSEEEEEKEEETTTEEGNAANCTLIWDFKTPAIYPRPNVTCGYYSYLYDDVTNPLPSGLKMELLTNGSWQAEIEHVHIQVSEIPREQRLGCAVRVPDTNYKRVIKFEDNFDIDHLIDSEGCNATFLDPKYRLEISYGDNGEKNCRGDIVPVSSNDPLRVQLACAAGDLAVFANGTSQLFWETEIACDPMDMTWRVWDQDTMTNRIGNIEDAVPVCVPNSSGGTEKAFASAWTLPTYFLVIFFSIYVR